MPILIALGILFALIVLLLSLRATVTVICAEELTVSVKVLGIRFRLYPKKERRAPRSMSARRARRIREKHRKKLAKKAEKKKEKQDEKKVQRGGSKKKSLSDILSLLRLITAILKVALKKFFKHIRIDLKRLHITVASPDAATTAVTYGAVTGAISALLPVIQSAKQFSLPKEGELDVTTDFLANTPSIDLHLSVSLRVWHVLDMAIGALWVFIKKKAEADAEEPKVPEKKFPPPH